MLLRRGICGGEKTGREEEEARERGCEVNTFVECVV